MGQKAGAAPSSPFQHWDLLNEEMHNRQLLGLLGAAPELLLSQGPSVFHYPVHCRKGEPSPSAATQMNVVNELACVASL